MNFLKKFDFFCKVSEEDTKPQSESLIDSAVPSVIRKKSSSEESSFLKGFNEKQQVPMRSLSPEDFTKNYWIPTEKPPMKMTQANKELLKRSIIVSLDLPVDRPDLEFVATSRIDGKPIYRYVGPMPFRLDIPFEEMMSFENFSEPKNEKVVSEYVDYLADQLDRSIQYSEYVAEQVNQNLRNYPQDDLQKRKSEMRKTWIQKYGNSHNLNE